MWNCVGCETGLCGTGMWDCMSSETGTVRLGTMWDHGM